MRKALYFLIFIALMLYCPFFLLSAYYLILDYDAYSAVALLLFFLPIGLLLFIAYSFHKPKKSALQSTIGLHHPTTSRTNQPIPEKKSFSKPQIPNALIDGLQFKADYKLTNDYVTDYVILHLLTVNQHDQDIIRVAASKYKDSRLTNQYYTCVFSEKEIEARTTIATGITAKDVKEAPPLERVLRELLHFIDRQTLIVHDVDSQMHLFLHHLRECEIEPPIFSVFDTFPSAQQLIPLVNYELPTLKTYLNLNELSSYEAMTNCNVIQKLYELCAQQSVATK